MENDKSYIAWLERELLISSKQTLDLAEIIKALSAKLDACNQTAITFGLN